jgi:hypothetical protein
VEDEIRRLVDLCVTHEGGNPLWPDGVDRFCAAHEVTADRFFELFARYVAIEFADGVMSFAAGDKAMNQLFGVADTDLRGFAWEIFEAFDAGEFRHGGDSDATVSWQKYTLPAVMEALANSDIAEGRFEAIADRTRLLLSLQRALLGEVVPQLRQASIESAADRHLVRVRFEFDVEPDEALRARYSRVGTEVMADFPSPWTIDEEYLWVESAKLSPLAYVAYRRAGLDSE